MIFLQHPHQARGDPLGERHRGPGADPEEFDVGDGPQSAQDLFQPLVLQQEGIASRQKHIPDPPMAFQILQGLIEIPLGDGSFVGSHQSSPGAVPAVGGALVGDQEQDAVGITVDEARDRRILVLSQGVDHVALRKVKFLDSRDRLSSNRTIGVDGIHEVRKIRGHGHGQPAFGMIDSFDLFRGQFEDLFNLVKGGDPVPKLPSPVIPFSFRNALRDPLLNPSSLLRLFGNGEQRKLNYLFAVPSGRDA